MKVLLSAYACEPNLGSEPGIGWGWTCELARLGYDVWVLTCASHHQKGIEAELSKTPPMPNVHFVFYDIPKVWRWWHTGGRGIRTHNFLWQWGAYRVAKRLHREMPFDLVHHITWGGLRQPSFMGNLGIPFVFGPVGGGEKAPWRLRIGYPLRGWALDAVRDLMNLAVRFDPFMRHTFRRATYIYVKTPETGRLIPAEFQSKVSCALEIGIDLPQPGRMGNERNADKFRILYVGRLLYWKGMHLGLQAFAKLTRSHPDARLTIVGDGPDGQWSKRLADRLQVSEKMEWVPWLDHDKLLEAYPQYDLLMFPSLHDSSGNVVLEAMAHGLPVVCLDLGGPGVMVDETCGRVVRTWGRSRDAVVDGLAHALTELADDPAARTRLAQGALARARKYAWDVRVKRFYSAYGTIDGHEYP